MVDYWKMQKRKNIFWVFNDFTVTVILEIQNRDLKSTIDSLLVTYISWFNCQQQ